MTPDFILPKPLLQDGRPVLLLASCLGEKTGGGLFAWDGSGLERIDALSSTGITLHDGRLTRLLRTHETLPGGEMLVYDARGVECYHRLDFLRDAHDVAWDGECHLVVSSGNNTVFRISSDGKIAGEWKMEGSGDSCHVNCLCPGGSGMLLCAFGMFPNHRDWNDHKGDGSGLVLDLETKEALIGGLDCPHHPRFFDGAMGVCNSASSEFLHIDLTNRKIIRRVQLNAWTRGVALSDDYIFVGESNRSITSNAGTSIAVLCRETWEVLGSLPVRCDEIYDLLLVPPEIAEGVRLGFNTNPQREAEQNQHALFQKAGVSPKYLWASGEPLPLEACKAEIICHVPTVLKTNALLELECTVKNRGSGVFASVPPNPVRISYKWKGTEENNKDTLVEGSRTMLPHPLAPGQSARCSVTVVTPAMPGNFTLILTLVQEYIAWFDQVDSASAFYKEVTVE